MNMKGTEPQSPINDFCWLPKISYDFQTSFEAVMDSLSWAIQTLNGHTWLCWGSANIMMFCLWPNSFLWFLKRPSWETGCILRCAGTWQQQTTALTHWPTVRLPLHVLFEIREAGCLDNPPQRHSPQLGTTVQLYSRQLWNSSEICCLRKYCSRISPPCLKQSDILGSPLNFMLSSLPSWRMPIIPLTAGVRLLARARTTPCSCHSFQMKAIDPHGKH